MHVREGQESVKVLAIDPGPEQSAYVLWDGEKLLDRNICPNETLVWSLLPEDDEVTAIEMVACYGMAVGKEVFETCLWIGRMVQKLEGKPRLIYRRDVKLHHCGNARAKDANIRQALIDKYGAPGTKANPGKLYGIKSHLWSALAIATMITEQAKEHRLSPGVISPSAVSVPLKRKSNVVVEKALQ